jgi:hypothetical protein
MVERLFLPISKFFCGFPEMLALRIHCGLTLEWNLVCTAYTLKRLHKLLKPAEQKPKAAKVFRRTLFSETGNTIFTEEVKNSRTESAEDRGWPVAGQLRNSAELRIRKRVQVIVEVEVEAGVYQLKITLFGRYRCHQGRIFRP